jgi:hypothetical protein
MDFLIWQVSKFLFRWRAPGPWSRLALRHFMRSGYGSRWMIENGLTDEEPKL